MAKRMITRAVSVGANATATPLDGTRIENVEVPSLLTLLAKAQSGSAGDVTLELYVANRNAVEQSDLLVASGALIVPDHVLIDDVEAYPGNKIQMVLRNTTAGAIVVDYRIILDDNVFIRG